MRVQGVGSTPWRDACEFNGDCEFIDGERGGAARGEPRGGAARASTGIRVEVAVDDEPPASAAPAAACAIAACMSPLAIAACDAAWNPAAAGAGTRCADTRAVVPPVRAVVPPVRAREFFAPAPVFAFRFFG